MSPTSAPDAEGYRTTFAFRVSLDQDETFTFEVDGWDIGETPITNAEAVVMAYGLVSDGVPLHGDLNGAATELTIDPRRVQEIKLT